MESTTIASARPEVGNSFFDRDDDGIFVPRSGLVHRDENYDSDHVELLETMQARHFWYRGRHRFILCALKHYLQRSSLSMPELSAIDLGGGCGGWIHYLSAHAPESFSEIALSDSNLSALRRAGQVLSPTVMRFQADVSRLPWRQRWHVAFLLDVLEHLPNDRQVIREIAATLRPGGLLFVTVPALKFFWSDNDELVHHQKRYTRGDFQWLADECGLENCGSRYFMTLLSPLVLLRRLGRRDRLRLSNQEIQEHLRRTHRIPVAPVNELLTSIFSLETPLGVHLPFPWGTSVLAVLRKPS